MVSKHASVCILSRSVNIHLFINHGQFILLCWRLTTPQPLWVILCCLPEKGRKEIEKIVEEMKDRDKE